jgi:hypothetical protein
MRRTLAVCVLIVLAWAAWVAWPFLALQGLVRAVEQRDAAALGQYIDLPSIRRDLSAQVFEAHARISGTPMPRGGVAGAIAASMAEPLLERVASPEALIELLRGGGAPASAQGESPLTLPSLRTYGAGDPWQVFLGSELGFDRFAFSYPPGAARNQQFRLEWKLSGWRWKLFAVKLPAAITDRLARELTKERGG